MSQIQFVGVLQMTGFVGETEDISDSEDGICNDGIEVGYGRVILRGLTVCCLRGREVPDGENMENMENMENLENLESLESLDIRFERGRRQFELLDPAIPAFGHLASGIWHLEFGHWILDGYLFDYFTYCLFLVTWIELESGVDGIHSTCSVYSFTTIDLHCLYFRFGNSNTCFSLPTFLY